MFKKVGNKIEEYNNGIIGDFDFNQSLQSYLGMLKHCAGYDLKIKIRNEVWLKTIG